MLKFIVQGVRCRVEGFLEERADLNHIMMTPDKQGDEEVMIPLFAEEEQFLLAGLLPEALSRLEKAGLGIEVEVVPQDDEFTRFQTEKITADCLSGKTLYPFQLEAANTALREKVGIIQIPTSGGKTLIAAAILTAFPRYTSIFYVPTVPLVHQVSERFREYGLDDVGIIGDSMIEPGRHTVADIRYVSHLLNQGNSDMRKLIQSAIITIVDECQHVGSRQWMLPLSLSNSPYRIGLSATPFRHRRHRIYRDYILMGVCGETIVRVKPSTLKEMGVIATPWIFRVPIDSKVINIKARGDSHLVVRSRLFKKVYQQGIVENDTRNQWSARLTILLVKTWGLRVLILVDRIQHGHEMLRRLESVVSAVFISGAGKVHRAEDGEIEETKLLFGGEKALTDFAHGKYDVLIASPVLGEGYDLPGDLVQAMILLSGGKSLIPVIQRLGRALRPKSGDNKVLIFDFDDQQHYWLANHSRKRFQEYKKEGYDILSHNEFLMLTKEKMKNG